MYSSVSPRQTWQHLILSALTVSVLTLLPGIARASEGSVPVTAVPVDGNSVAIRQWLIAGPFPSPNLADREDGGPMRAGYDTDYLTPIGGETEAHPVDGTAVPLPDGGSVRFTTATWDDDYINIVPQFGMLYEVLAYLYCEVESPVEQEVYLHVGSNDAAKFWVGGELAVRHPFDRGAEKSQNVAKVTLKAGRTPILAKIDQAGFNWGMYVEIYGKTEHESILAKATPEAVEQSAQLLAEAIADVGDPTTLTGVRRDAYALARYYLARLESVVSSGDDEVEWDPSLFDFPRYASLLAEAAEAARDGRDMYAGKTGTFEAAYLSNADGTGQPMTLCVPPTYDPARQYMLAIDMHGAGGTHQRTANWWQSATTRDSAYYDQTIALAVLGRGRYSGYAGLGEDDVLRAIEWVTENYSIDPDRIYVTGTSMGGGGSWRMAAQYPDMFAAAWPECGWPDWTVVENTSNLPMYLNHGNGDWTVPVTYTRLGANRLSERGYPVMYTEWYMGEHGISATARLDGWMSKLGPHVRVVDPVSVNISTDHPRCSEMYWAGVDEWIDPYEVAKLSARVLPGNAVSVSMVNVGKAHLTPPAKHLSGGDQIVWLVNGQRIAIPKSTDGVYEIVRDDVPVVSVGSDTFYTVRPYVEPAEPAERPYVAGATMNLYRGEPLLIVYGTHARDEQVATAIRKMADDAAHWLSATGDWMEFGTVPVKADDEVTSEDIAAKNLFIIGGPRHNSVAARLMRKLPVKEERGSLRVFDEAPVPLDGRGYAFVYKNTEAPKRLIAVYSSDVPQYYTLRRGMLASWPVNELGSQAPDIAIEQVAEVENGDDPAWNRIVRQYRFTHGWELQDSSRPAIGRHPKNTGELMEFLGRAMIKASGADFAMADNVEHPEAPIPYVPEEVSWYDARDALMSFPLVFEMSGADLLRFARHEDSQFPWIYPAVDPAAIDEAKTYRIVEQGWTLWGFVQGFHWNPERAEYLEDPELYERCLRDEWDVE